MMLRPLVVILSDIKLAHTVFAMPFALLGAALGWACTPDAEQTPRRALVQFALVIACTVVARTWAMVINRLADRGFDAANPRTAQRAFAAGRATMRSGWAVLIACAALFAGLCTLFGVFFGNWWPLMLAAPVLGWIGLYSFTKRFTWLCHVFLGSSLAISPVAAALAVEPASLTLAPGVWWIAAMVLCWVAGFDVIYALQDLDFDRQRGLKSMPARFGWRGSIWISRVLHGLSLAALASALVFEPRFAGLAGAGALVVFGVLVAEHVVLARRGREGIPMAFFTLNGVVSLVLAGTAMLDVLLV